MPYYTVVSSKSKAESKKGAAGAASPAVAIERLTSAVVEAACIVAIVSLPLYFTVVGNGYESDKAVLLRVLACITAAAWSISTVSRSFATDRSSRNIVILGGLLFLAFCLATALSIDPRLSLWGSHGRQQGLWTYACYVIFFVAIVTQYRSAPQMTRLISALLLGSVPVIVYGCAQEFGLDPYTYSASPDTARWPVWSTFGEHVFFGSYLVMLIPFTLSRLVASARDTWSDSASGWLVDRHVLIAAATIIATIASLFLFLWTSVGHPGIFAAFPALLALYSAIAVGLSLLPSTPAVRRAALTGYATLLTLDLVALWYSGARAALIGLFFGLVAFFGLSAARLSRQTLERCVLVFTTVTSPLLGLPMIFVRRRLSSASPRRRLLMVTAVTAFSINIGLLVLLNIPNGPLQSLREIHALNRIANITDSGGSQGSAQGRLLIWQGVLKAETQPPSIQGNWGGPGRTLLGYGPESMVFAFQPVFPLQLRQVNSEINVWDRAHNIYLDYLIDAGLVGLLLLIALVAVFFWRLISNIRHISDSAAWIAIPAGASVAGHLADGFFSIETTVTLLFFWMFIGLAVGRALPGSSAPDPFRLSTISVSFSLLGFALLAGACIALLTTLTDRPLLYASVWLLVILVSVGAIGLLVHSAGSVTSQAWRRRWLTPVVGVLVLLSLIGLASQVQFQAAAVANHAGLNYLFGGQSTQALSYLQQAVQWNGYDPQYQTDLAEPYLVLASNRADSAEPGYVPAGNDFRTVDPQRASTFGKDQLFQLELQALESARNLSPLDPDMHDNLGNLYLQSQRPVQAAAEFARAESLSPQNPRYVAEGALALLDARHARQAIGRAQTALALDTTYWLSHCVLSRIQHQQGNHGAAKSEALLASYWARNFWPPPNQQLGQLCAYQTSG